MKTYKLKPKKYSEEAKSNWLMNPKMEKMLKNNQEMDFAEKRGKIKRKIKQNEFNTSLSESMLDNLEPEEFQSPIEAIKWCNEKFRELKDKKYKQIDNYLHIYK